MDSEVVGFGVDVDGGDKEGGGGSSGAGIPSASLSTSRMRVRRRTIRNGRVSMDTGYSVPEPLVYFVLALLISVDNYRLPKMGRFARIILFRPSGLKQEVEIDRII